MNTAYKIEYHFGTEKEAKKFMKDFNLPEESKILKVIPDQKTKIWFLVNDKEMK